MDKIGNWVIGVLLVAVVASALFPTIITQFAAVTGANGVTAIFSVMAVILAAVLLWRLASGAFSSRG